MDYMQIHETVVRDIMDAITDLKNVSDDINPVARARSRSSIMKSASDLVIVFPFMCDNTVDISTATMNAKAIERQAVAMLQLLFSACSITNAENGADFIRQFHKNIGNSNMIDIDDFVDIMDKYVESANVDVDYESYNAIKESLLTLDFTLPDSINESSLMDFDVVTRGEMQFVNEAGRRRHSRRSTPRQNDIRNNYDDTMFDVGVANVPLTGVGAPRPVSDRYHDVRLRNVPLADNDAAAVSAARSSNRSGRNTTATSASRSNGSDGNGNSGRNNNGGSNGPGFSVSNSGNTTNNYYGSNNRRGGDLNNAMDLAKFYKDMSDFHRNSLIDGDVKKANELMPSLMTVNFVSTGPDGKDPVPVSFVCGVKCRLIPVDPYDIANHIITKHQDRNVLNNFIRATTKEISFFKDFLFAVDKAKIDAISRSKKGSSHPMWKVLERRANASKIKQWLRQPNNCAAITTLGVSKELVEYIKKQNNINLENPKEAAKIMESLNLMGFIIIDEAAEVDSIMWDNGERQYESLSFNALERDTSGSEYRKAINLMSKTYR